MKGKLSLRAAGRMLSACEVVICWSLASLDAKIGEKVEEMKMVVGHLYLMFSATRSTRSLSQFPASRLDPF